MTNEAVDPVAQLRRFNRAFTERIGVLDESFLGSGRPLGPSRLLFDIGRAGADIGTLRSRLNLDSGYLSRMLRQLESEGLITVEVDPLDSRRRKAALTPTGELEWQTLDDRSQDAAMQLLDPLSNRQRAELQASLATSERLLRAATVRLELIAPDHPFAAASMAAYFAELDDRFADGFDPGTGADESLRHLRRPDGGFMVALDGDEAVGCGGFQRIELASPYDNSAPTAEVKRMWVHPERRGLGLGRRLLQALEDDARAVGYRRVVLDTNSALTEAITMYESHGYQSIERYNDNPYALRWFSKSL